ncbi:spermidine/spermine N(1)-acetyltransferase-like protein 1 [Echinops telfairi]|uniref:Spermidine/spermine N(1)-acetyltransferase-like protein 1 n=1 Tax=Echinops telfairi TaxID=9371 RepID=A0ABM1VM25_ECHTE|nr:spermidine/spermine N(1)-acetyltransferase-like protein 1 [Echinops telfairi]
MDQPGMTLQSMSQQDKYQRVITQPGSFPVRNQSGTRQPGTRQENKSQSDIVINISRMDEEGTTLPSMNQPAMSQPTTSLTGIYQPGMIQPGLRHPGTSLPAMNQPGTSQLGTSQRGISQPGMCQLGTSLPVKNQPGTSQLGTSQQGMSQSGISTNLISMDQPGMTLQSMSQQDKNQPVITQPGINQRSISLLDTNQPYLSQAGMRPLGLSTLRVRHAEARDCPEILRLIKELAACENMVDAVKLTVPDLLRDGFGENPLFYCLIAEIHYQHNTSGKVYVILTVGFAMYYFTYDPWTGKLLYLEDFYVIQAYRGLGIGAEMLKRLSQIAIKSQCNCMDFLVVIWNQASIEYYTRRGASDLSSEEGWHLFRFNREKLIEMASGE